MDEMLDGADWLLDETVHVPGAREASLANDLSLPGSWLSGFSFDAGPGAFSGATEPAATSGEGGMRAGSSAPVPTKERSGTQAPAPADKTPQLRLFRCLEPGQCVH